MTRLEELFELNKKLTEELKPIQEKHKMMEEIIQLKEVDVWKRMIDDCLALSKYNCILDTGIIAVNQATYGFVISKDCDRLTYEHITHKNGIACAESYIMSINKENPYRRCNEGWSSTDSIYIKDLKKDVIENWDVAYKNIKLNIEKELEHRMREKIKKEIQKEKNLTKELSKHGIIII